MLVARQWIKIYDAKVNLTYLDYCYEIIDENICSLNKLDQNINCIEQW
jgi:hypothetical protein